MAPIGIATRSPKHQADEDDVFDTLSMRARSGRAVIEHEGSWSWPILTVDVTNHSICSDSCKTVKITCHIRLPDRVRRGASIESFPPVFQCWCWCAKPCDSIVERKSYSLPMEWLDAFNNKVLKLASRSVRHGPVRYLRCLSSGCGFFFFLCFWKFELFFFPFFSFAQFSCFVFTSLVQVSMSVDNWKKNIEWGSTMSSTVKEQSRTQRMGWFCFSFFCFLGFFLYQLFLLDFSMVVLFLFCNLRILVIWLVFVNCQGEIP